MTQLSQVKEFHKAADVAESIFPSLNKTAIDLRGKLMQEELDEYKNAKNKEEILDSLVDQMYILCGTILIHGMEDIFEKAFNEVHRSNMSKCNEKGVFLKNGINCPMDDNLPYGKIIKGPNYSPPNFENILY